MYCFRVIQNNQERLEFIEADSVIEAEKRIKNESIYTQKVELMGETLYYPEKEMTVHLRHAMY